MFVISVGKECNELGILLYEDLGCTPEYNVDQDCPTKYTCKGLEPSTDHCIFRGRSYADKETVNDTFSYGTCRLGCYCTTNDDNPRFQCAVLDCPEWLGGRPREGCYSKYSLGKCCSTGSVCPPFDDTDTCVVEGNEYKVGQKFWPSHTCLECVCQKGFIKGKFEAPFCQSRLCGEQLDRHGPSIQASCAPLYGKHESRGIVCCPKDWICPDGNETINGEIKSEETCKFGNTTVKVGQYFERSNTRCECVIPPLLKCIEV
ncbi:hypothetical protein Zmor_015239 [Zophobas morio]|uniref:VWFC domain-containing protein n=1 Tax=Zophobas morio TaxID=2755281 RepID=A0AA38IL88_9CUCU|nr:hypothetical protein Zmor_015239 [Zophobas morio]